jgi:hypothetical protein
MNNFTTRLAAQNVRCNVTTGDTGVASRGAASVTTEGGVEGWKIYYGFTPKQFKSSFTGRSRVLRIEPKKRTSNFTT